MLFAIHSPAVCILRYSIHRTNGLRRFRQCICRWPIRISYQCDRARQGGDVPW